MIRWRQPLAPPRALQPGACGVIERDGADSAMTCRELIEFLMAYLDGELPPASRRVFDAHLAACPPCRRYLASYREAIALGRAAFQPDHLDEPVRDDVPEDLVRAILAARESSR